MISSVIVLATSVYDNTLVLTPDLKYNDVNETVISISETWRSHMASACGSTVYNDFLQAFDDGAWAVLQDSTDDDYGITVIWSKSDQTIPHSGFHTESLFNPSLKYFAVDPGWQGKARFHFNSTSDVHVCDYSTVAINNPYGSVLTREDWMMPLGLFVSSYIVDYPSGYTGSLVPTLDDDIDRDGLNAANETMQNTSNFKKDTDEDGLSDYTESQWNLDRDSVFCGTQCTYPNPTTRDIYIEVDWMKDASNNVYKPNLTQISLVEDMFEDKGINLHVDTGQFGGGNELSLYTQTLPYTVAPSQIDFWDYKNGGDGIMANFATDRNSIWRYMIYGYNYLEKPNSSGWAETMGDDLFISLGRIETMSGIVSLDRAVAGTMAHEIGHSLCLSDDKVFEEQPDECVYDGIDNDDENDSEYNLENYESVMNYRYQLTNHDDLGIVDYSDGSHGLGDHDDWGAVALGMGGFSGTRTALGAEEIASNYYVTPDGSVIVEESSIEEMLPQAAQNQEENSDNPSTDDATKPNTDDSDMGMPVGEGRDRSALSDWMPVIVASGVVALFTIIEVLLYLKKRNK